MKKYLAAVAVSVLIGAFCVSLGLLTSGCTKPDLATALQDAKWGLVAVCAIGQDTLPAVVCSDGLNGLDAAVAIAQHDPAHAAAAVKAFLAGLALRHPELHDFWAFITDKL